MDNKLQMAKALIDAGINYPRVYFIEEDAPDEPGEEVACFWLPWVWH
jgi:hypothetical protein